jgi:drug/metabolite transporter (DMT)-like permease
MSRTIILLLMVSYAITGATGDVLLSHGSRHSAVLFLLGGVACCAIGYGIFLRLLRQLPCSVVVPAQASTYLVTVTASWLVLHEVVPPLRWIGTLLISAGVAMVVLSESPREIEAWLERRRRRHSPPAKSDGPEGQPETITESS